MEGRKGERRGGEGRLTKLRTAHPVGNLQLSLQKVNFNFLPCFTIIGTAEQITSSLSGYQRYYLIKHLLTSCYLHNPFY